MPMTKRKIRNVVRTFYGSPWAILEEKYEEIASVLERRAYGEILEASELQAITAEHQGQEPEFDVPSGVGVVALEGIVSQRMNLMTNISGGTSTEMLTSEIKAMGKDSSLHTVVMAVDSPGGSINGVPEAARAWRELGKTKHTIAVARPTMASAAYWLASGANEIWAQPDSVVGSIGAMMEHRDTTVMDEKMGVKRTRFKTGSMKAAGAEGINPAIASDIQEKVETAFGLFLSDVTAGRPQLSAPFLRSLEGNVFLGEEAKAKGLVDKIGTLSDVLGSLSSKTLGLPRRSFAACISAFLWCPE